MNFRVWTVNFYLGKKYFICSVLTGCNCHLIFGSTHGNRTLVLYTWLFLSFTICLQVNPKCPRTTRSPILFLSLADDTELAVTRSSMCNRFTTSDIIWSTMLLCFSTAFGSAGSLKSSYLLLLWKNFETENAFCNNWHDWWWWENGFLYVTQVVAKILSFCFGK